VALAALAGARDLSGWSWALVVPGAALLAAPAWLAHKGRMSRKDILLRDLPSLLLVAGLGWGAGLLPAMLWRLLVVIAQVPALVERAPRAGSDVLFATLLALPLATELAVRDGYLDTGWSSEHLSGAELGAGDDASRVVPYWSASCGADPKLVWWFGGSSAGGAYQMEGRPGDFFPGQIHRSLCDQGMSVHTVNFSDGGRDTFTFSRALPDLMAKEAPDLVVIYVGVNDILTANSALTRKQREAARAAESAGTGWLAELAAHSRVVAGLSLLNRPAAGGDETAFVAAVPVADAEENLRQIITGVEARGGRVLLVPELTRLTTPDPLGPYRVMEKRLAGDEPSAEWMDVVDQAAQLDTDAVFVDRNHLSSAGHAEVAIRLAPTVATLLEPRSAPIPQEASP
jgi:lysophospholipase L1-like esterase